MGEDRSRKSKRRSVRRDAPPDPSLIELALALDESRLSDDVEGWFSVPWNDGWLAARLAMSVRPGPIVDDLATAREQLSDWFSIRDVTCIDHGDLSANALYESAGALMGEFLPRERLLYASARCLQLLAANSHGGGHVYNSVLMSAFYKTWGSEPIDQEIRQKIRAIRCEDALGVKASLQNDHWDRMRRAFVIAWDRGLYRAAYSLPRNNQ